MNILEVFYFGTSSPALGPMSLLIFLHSVPRIKNVWSMTVNVNNFLISEALQTHPPDVFPLADHTSDVISSADEETIIYCEDFPHEDANERQGAEGEECIEKGKEYSLSGTAEEGVTELKVAMEVEVETSQDVVLKCN